MFGTIERALIQVTKTDIYMHACTYSYPQYTFKPKQDTAQTNSFLCFVCLQNNSMSLPVVYLDPMLDEELASRLTTIVTKHQVKCCRVLQMRRQGLDVLMVEKMF